MPSIDTYTPLVCLQCGSFATHISVNGRKPRCNESITRCPEVIEKQKLGRDKNWDSEEAKRAHMKAMSDKGNASPKRKTVEYKANVGGKISAKIVESGRMNGESNPNYGGKITDDPAIRSKMRKPKMDSSKMGRWERTIEYRDYMSDVASNRRPLYRRTSIELAMIAFVESIGYTAIPELLIASKEHKGYGKMTYRHVYDIHVPELNLLIECDGEYWHGNLESWDADTKASYLANHKGYRVLRISETYIRNLEHHQHELLEVMASDSAFAVLGDFYNTVPPKKSIRNSKP